METPPDTRVSVSLAQLRAELTAMELRIVDRLNGALANKADRAIQEQLSQRVSDYGSRITTIENTMLKNDGPLVLMVASHEKQLVSLQSVAGYKKWLWAQTVALVAIAVPLIAVGIDLLRGG